MIEYIEREAALNAVKELPSAGGCSAVDRDDAENAISNIPAADVVEVVRCKDCVYSFMSISGESVLYCEMRPSDDHLGLNKNYYCSDGERREG